MIHVKEIFKRYIADGGVGNVKVLAQLNNISLKNVYSSSPQWEPEGGCQFLLQMPSTTVYGAKQIPIETKKEMHNELVDEQRNFWTQALYEKRKHIDNAKKYDGPQDMSW